MAKSYPESIPDAYKGELETAYRRGWNRGHGIACHNVPHIGQKLFVEDMGRVTVTAELIRDVHQSLCFAAETHGRDFSPFEFIAHDLNSADEEQGEGASEELWSAFDAGINDAIAADLAEYTDEDYGITDDEG